MKRNFESALVLYEALLGLSAHATLKLSSESKTRKHHAANLQFHKCPYDHFCACACSVFFKDNVMLCQFLKHGFINRWQYGNMQSRFSYFFLKNKFCSNAEW